MYIQYQNYQFFLPFSVNCSQVAMSQIMPAWCPHGQGEEEGGGGGGKPMGTGRGRGGGGGGGGGGGVKQMRTGPGKGREVPKIPKFVRTSFMDDPQGKI